MVTKIPATIIKAGKAVASKDNISTRSTRSESDFVVIDKSSQKDNNCDGGATSNSEDNVDQEQFLLQEQNNLLVTKLLSIYDNISDLLTLPL